MTDKKNDELLKIATDNQERYSGALETIQTLATTLKKADETMVEIKEGLFTGADKQWGARFLKEFLESPKWQAAKKYMERE